MTTDERPAPDATATEVRAICSRCTGGGMITTGNDCPECLGSPTVNIDGNTIVCSTCQGTGLQNVTCPQCAGKGMIHVKPSSE